MKPPTEPAQPAATLRFGRCEVRPLERQLRVAGELQDLPARTFDLLLLLLQGRDRVLSKRELIAALWGDTPASDGVLARYVMQLRRAIGDNGDSPAWIKTAHGYGYRFIGKVSELALPAPAKATPAPQAAASPVAPTLARLGVLPLVNATGEPRLDWIEVGLMALVTQALGASGACAVVTSKTMLEVVSQAGIDAPVEDHAQLAINAFGLDCVVHAVLRRTGAGYWLDYRLFRRGQATLSGSLRDADFIGSAAVLASELARHVSPGGGAEAAPFVSSDPFVNQAYARGLALLMQDDAQHAAALFEVVCRMEPEALAPRLAQLRCAALRDDAASALKLGRDCLSRAELAGDIDAQGEAHVVLCHVLRRQGEAGTAAESDAHMASALRLARGREGQAWVSAARNNWASLLISRGRMFEAREVLDALESSARAHGETFALSATQYNAALIDVALQDLVRARDRLEETLPMLRQLHRQRGLAMATALLAMVDAQLGFIDRAAKHAEAVLQIVGGLDNLGPSASALSAVAVVFLERGDADGAARTLALFGAVDEGSAVALRAPALATRAVLSLCQGQVAAARQQLFSAAEVGEAVLGHPFLRVWLHVLLRLQAATADAAGVQQVAERIQALPGLASDLSLRASLVHAEAALHWRVGHRDAAMAALQRLTEELPVGRGSASARLDLAWLCLEAGDPARAQRMLAGAGAWRDGHPVGMAVHARWLASQGQHDQAAQWQARALANHRGAPPPEHLALQGAYERGRAPWPALDRPVSLSWMARETDTGIATA